MAYTVNLFPTNQLTLPVKHSLTGRTLSIDMNSHQVRNFCSFYETKLRPFNRPIKS